MVGGRNVFLQALANSKNPAAQGLISALGKVENDNLSIYEVALSVRCDPLEIQRSFSEGLQVHQAMEAFNKLFIAIPDVMDSAIESARVKGKDGKPDREMLFKMAGLFPKDGGININLNQNFEDMVRIGGGEPVARGSRDLLHKDPYTIDIPVEKEE